MFQYKLNTSTKRIIKGFFLPLLIGTFFVWLGAYTLTFLDDERKHLFAALDWNFFKEAIISLFALLIYSILVMPQSLIYSLLMEKLVNPKVRQDKIVLLISCCLAIISMLPIALLFKKNFLLLILMSIITGFIVGWILRRDYLKQKAIR